MEGKIPEQRIAETCVRRIVRDLCDRRLRQEWEQVDNEVQGEIRKKWVGIIVGAIRENKVSLCMNP